MITAIRCATTRDSAGDKSVNDDVLLHGCSRDEVAQHQVLSTVWQVVIHLMKRRLDLDWVLFPWEAMKEENLTSIF